MKTCRGCGTEISRRAVMCRSCSIKLAVEKNTKGIVDRDRMIQMYESGMATTDIARETGLSKGAVYSWLSRRTTMRSYSAGIKMKYPDGKNGALASHWKGGRIAGGVESKYILIYSPTHPHKTKDGYVMEHRLVMEAKLGRYLERTEYVHHINGNPKDNSPDNLELVTRKEHYTKHFSAVKVVEALKSKIAELEGKLKLYEEKYGVI